MQPLKASYSAGRGSSSCGGNHASVGHLVGFGNTEEQYMSIVFGCKERGRRSEGPFDHGTGKGWVKAKDGQYKDALNKRTQVNLMLVESLGGVASGSRHRVRRLGRRAEGKGSVDRTKYGRTRISTKCFYTHHMQQLSKAAVVGDSRQVRRAVTMHKQKAWAARTGGTA